MTAIVFGKEVVAWRMLWLGMGSVGYGLRANLWLADWITGQSRDPAWVRTSKLDDGPKQGFSVGWNE